MRAFLIAGLAVAVSGCGNISNIRAYNTAYVEPAAGDTARVRVITNGMARGVPGRDCIDWRVPGAGVMAVSESGFAGQNNGRSLGMPESNRRVEAQALVRSELKVPADKPFAMNFQSEGSHSYSCKQSFYFTPKAGQDYELILLDGGQCLIALQHLNPTGKPQNVPVQKAKLCNAMDMF
ncbi:hypothetical protein IFT48_29490 [Pseudomonas fluorescens]|uniref:hypothetical protein n=1 Tax=Pseudomonas fluorescens TaxID=294 RepID=UPI00190523DC|nr:hypothetical protein [Pseudomonas fluorescens]MBD8094134.1 hypothetical protein [Pseudomonas fluorescens]MBD8721322.1 hypothetical protein [Pseudomonas fluorescens]